VPVPDCDVVLVEKDKVQHGWPIVVNWIEGGYVGGVCKAKICCIAEVD